MIRGNRLFRATDSNYRSHLRESVVGGFRHLDSQSSEPYPRFDGWWSDGIRTRTNTIISRVLYPVEVQTRQSRCRFRSRSRNERNRSDGGLARRRPTSISPIQMTCLKGTPHHSSRRAAHRTRSARGTLRPVGAHRIRMAKRRGLTDFFRSCDGATKKAPKAVAFAAFGACKGESSRFKDRKPHSDLASARY